MDCLPSGPVYLRVWVTAVSPPRRKGVLYLQEGFFAHLDFGCNPRCWALGTPEALSLVNSPFCSGYGLLLLLDYSVSNLVWCSLYLIPFLNID